ECEELGERLHAVPPWLAASRNDRLLSFRQPNGGGLRVLPWPLCGAVRRTGRLSGQRGVVRALSYRAALPAPEAVQGLNRASVRVSRRFIALQATRDLHRRGRDDRAGARLDAHYAGASVMRQASSTRGRAHAVRYLTLSESRWAGGFSPTRQCLPFRPCRAA